MKEINFVLRKSIIFRKRLKAYVKLFENEKIYMEGKISSSRTKKRLISLDNLSHPKRIEKLLTMKNIKNTSSIYTFNHPSHRVKKAVYYSWLFNCYVYCTSHVSNALSFLGFLYKLRKSSITNSIYISFHYISSKLIFTPYIL